MSERHRNIATAANRGDIRNIIDEVPIKPTKLVPHEKYLYNLSEIFNVFPT